MTATLHKVLAGNGYLYYLRQVAAGDSTGLGTDPLADYYSAHGESPGRWHGTGLAALNISAGDQVTEEQMKALFGEGRHPDANAIQDRVFDHEIARGATTKAAVVAAEKATLLGRPYRVHDTSNEYRERCGDAFRKHNISQGNDPSDAISDDVRARIRTEVATAMFTAQFERAPLDARELSSWVARVSRPKAAAVAAFDITFSPVKSVSALWAIAPRASAERIAAAHEAAVDDAIAWLERHGIYTRLGRNGVRQVDVEGIVAARFTHRESRSGDPDLHTHVLIANRVRTLEGLWRTLDASMIYRLTVVVSEIYNSRLEQHLTAELNLQFAERPGTDPAKRPIREIIGVPWGLIEHWSRRDAAITSRLGELATSFQQRVGREPMPKEMYGLAEQATLDTRPRKHTLRSLAEQRADWRAQAVAVLGGREALATALTGVFRQPLTPPTVLDAAARARVAEQILETVSGERSTWQWHHIRAEAERRLRGLVDRDRWAETVDAVTAHALAPQHSIARRDPDTAEPALGRVPAVFQRRSGASVYSTAGAQPYTSPRRLEVTDRLIELSLQTGARTIPEPLITAAIDAYNSDPAHQHRQLNAGQIAVVRAFARSQWRIETTNAPAGAGKTTAMRVLADAWRASGGTVLGLAPTAAAAAELAAATGARTETADRLLTIINAHTPAQPSRKQRRENGFPGSVPQWVLDIGRGTLVIVDEHIKLGDDKRLRLFEFLTARDAVIRCVGDDRQLPAIEAAGSAADTADAARASTLSHVVRFADTAEGSASLLLRDGDPAGFAYYLDHQRIHSGAPATVHDHTYAGWIADHLAGRDALMLAPTHAIVTDLNERARADRLARSTPGTDIGLAVRLSDDLFASAGDIICTRRNDPGLQVGDHDWVRNGYRWLVTAVHPDGSISARHLRSGRRLGHTTVLPANYARAHVRLGYAVTIDSAQGITVDTCHIALTGAESRNQLYVALTRGAHANHLYVPTAIDGSEASFWTEPGLMPRTESDVLLRILSRDATKLSALSELRDALDPHRRIGRAVDIYLDAIGVAAEHALGRDALARLDNDAEDLHPGLTDAPAYPVLRQHLATIALSGHDPITALHTAIQARELHTADDIAAVLDWRLDPSGTHSTGPGPLPWLRGLPHGLPDDAITEQLHARHRIITDLAEQITHDERTWTAATAPPWAQPLLGNPRLITDLTIWRAANHVPDTDLRPTGPTRYPVLEREHQALLDARVTDAVGDLHTAVGTWSGLAKRVDARIIADPWWPVLAERLDTAATAGLDIDALLTDAAAQRPLPDQMPAAALWLRLGLDPAALSTAAAAHNLRPEWTDHLHQLLGSEAAGRVITDPAWPRLVAAVDRTTGTDWNPADLLTTAYELLRAAQPDTTGLRPDRLATALTWRVEALLRPEPPTTTEPASAPITDTAAHDMNSHNNPSPTQPQTGPPPQQPQPSPDSSVPEQLRAVSDLFRTGHIPEATTRFRTVTEHLTVQERDIVEKVANTLYTNSFPIARARLRWAADRYPQHRDLILACIPDTDPHTYTPNTTTNPPASARPVGNTAARDHREWTDPTRRTARPPDTKQDFVDGYLDTRGAVDDDPDHLPMPDGIIHRYRTDARDHQRPDGYTLDYDRAAVPRSHGFGCLHCGIERAVADTTPTSGRRSDDGLCADCRDDRQPGIPDHNPADHIPARCTHITTTYPPEQARAKLRRDWRDAPTRRDRHAIHTWVTAHPFPDTPPTTMPAVDTSDPVQMLTDRELTAHIAHTEHRLTMPADEDILFGPATPDDEDHAEPTVQVGWLRNELADLRAEQHRRSQLPPGQAAAEHLARTLHRPDIVTDPMPDSALDAARDTATRHDDLGL